MPRDQVAKDKQPKVPGQGARSAHPEWARPDRMTESLKPGASSPKPGTRRRRIALGSLVLVLLAAMAFGALLASGPVRVPFLGSILAQQGSRGPAALSVGSASVDFTAPEGIRIVLNDANLEIAGKDGGADVSVSLPRIEAPIDGSALMGGQVHFSSLILDRPKVQIRLAGTPAKAPEMGSLIEAVDRVSDVVDDQFARRNLEVVRIRNGSVVTHGNWPRRFGKINANIFRNQNKTIRAFAKVAGRVSTWTLELARSAPEGGVHKTVGLVINGITLAELLGEKAVPAPGKGLRLPASAKLEARLTPEGRFVSSNVVARVSNGWFQMGPTLIAFDDAALSLVFSADTPDIQITKSHVIRGNTKIFVSGRVSPPETADGMWGVHLETEYPQFGPADVSEPPQMIEGAFLHGRFDRVDRTFFIDHFVVRSGRAFAQGVGSLQIGADGPYLALAAEGENVPVALAKQVWPITVVPPARRWVIDHIKGGLIETFSFTGALSAPAFDATNPDPGWSGNDMLLDLTFSRGRVQPVGEVPEISGLVGELTVKDEILTVEARDGSTRSVLGGEVTVAEGVFKIHKLRLRDGKTAELELIAHGSNRDIGSLADSEPFKVLERAKLNQDGVTGNGTVKVVATFPLQKKIELDDIAWRAEARSKDFNDTNPIMGHTVQKADVVVNADPVQVAIAGRGILDGLPADIDLVVPLDGSADAARQDVVVSVTAKQLKDKGVDLTTFLSGPMVLTLAKEAEAQVFAIDLQQTTVKLEALGWEKSSGVPATARFRLVEHEQGREVRDFELSSEGVNVVGDIDLDLAGDLLSARFARFHLRPGDDAALTIGRQANRRYKVALTGKAFDGRGLIREVRSPGGSQGDGDFVEGASIDAKLDRVTGFGGVIMHDFNGMIETDRKGLASADLKGKISGKSSFEFALKPSDGVKVATGLFEDAGATLRFLDLYERMQGGKGKLNVVMADEDSWVGDFAVKSLTISEDPAIRKLRQQESRTVNPIKNPGARIVASGTPGNRGSAFFDTLEINFTRDGDIMTITRGALQGTVLGGTVAGTVDLNTQSTDLAGTFVPIYALNSVFSRIPVLGYALGGSSGEGLIGVTYRISGPLSDPVLSVNPISVIAPGIFRKMFEFQQNGG